MKFLKRPICLKRRLFNVPKPLFIRRYSSHVKLVPVIGLEIHAQINSKSKLFSRAKTSVPWESYPNRHVSFVDNGFPGTLPVLNTRCVDQAIMLGLALNSQIHPFSTFDRKHYFYPDLPNGYQITQFHNPLITGGYLDLPANNNQHKRIRITQVQLEIDSAKSIHDREPGLTLLDFNRAGTGLLEIVTQPDFSNSEEAGIFIRKLQHLLRHLGISQAHMEDGELRCDVNVSVAPVGAPLGNRCEVKNVASVKSVMRAIDFEIERQSLLLKEGILVKRETRSFDASVGKTVFMRAKEDEVDYRFMPEPDLPPLCVDLNRISKIRQEMKELPEALKIRFKESFPNLPISMIELLVDLGASNFFEKTLTPSRDPKDLAFWIINVLLAHLNDLNISMDKNPIPAVWFSELLDLLDQGYISRKSAKIILQLVFSEPERLKQSAHSIVRMENLEQLSDPEILRPLCEEAIQKASPSVFEKYQKAVQNKNEYQIHKAIGVYVEDVLKRTDRKGNPILIQNLVSEMLKNKIS